MKQNTMGKSLPFHSENKVKQGFHSYRLFKLNARSRSLQCAEYCALHLGRLLGKVKDSALCL